MNYNQSIMTLPFSAPVILSSEDRLMEAAHAMNSNTSGSVIVNDAQNGELLGIVTDRDICLAINIGDKTTDSPLIELVGSEFIGVRANGNLADIIATMMAHGIRRVPIVEITNSKKYRCTGVISLDDLIREKLISLDDLSEVLQVQLKPPRQNQLNAAPITANGAI